MTDISNIWAIKKSIFLISKAKKTFNYLLLAFIKALIFSHFDQKNYIQIKTDILNYTIDRVLSQLNLDSNTLLNNLSKSDFSWWYPVV